MLRGKLAPSKTWELDRLEKKKHRLFDAVGPPPLEGSDYVAASLANSRACGFPRRFVILRSILRRGADHLQDVVEC